MFIIPEMIIAIIERSAFYAKIFQLVAQMNVYRSESGAQEHQRKSKGNEAKKTKNETTQ